MSKRKSVWVVGVSSGWDIDRSVDNEIDRCIGGVVGSSFYDEVGNGDGGEVELGVGGGFGFGYGININKLVKYGVGVKVGGSVGWYDYRGVGSWIGGGVGEEWGIDVGV